MTDARTTEAGGSRPVSVELRNVHYYARMSEETDCFDATVYVDGKKVGTVSNHGQGGPNDYSFDTRPYDARAAAMRPPKVYGDRSYPFELDDLVGEAFDVWLRAREVKRMTKNGARSVWHVRGENRDSYHTRNVPWSPESKAWIVAKYGDRVDRFVNEEGLL